MPPLKSLQQEFPIINAQFLDFCASHGIFSVEDFLVNNIETLVAFAECQATSRELKQGIAHVLSIIDKQHQPWLNGLELLENTQQNQHAISTGCEGIDKLLQGGLLERNLIELVGPSSCGKTQVCLQAASHIAHKYACTVMFLDTCNSFSPKRIARLVNCHLDPSTKEEKYKSLQRVMSSIVCHSVFDIFMMLDILHQLEFTFRSQVESPYTKMRLLIVDSISSLISPILGGKSFHGHSLMIYAGFLLKKLAFEYNLSVLVTNHMVAGEEGVPKPALGESWKSMPHVRLLLSREPRSNACNMTLLKHTSMVCGQVASFTVYDE